MAHSELTWCEKKKITFAKRFPDIYLGGEKKNTINEAGLCAFSNIQQKEVCLVMLNEYSY